MTIDVHVAMTKEMLGTQFAGAVSTNIPLAQVLDVTDPESLFQFFQLQMKDVRSKLGAMMLEQDARTKRCGQLQSLAATLTKYQESGVRPGDEGWAEFAQTAKDAIALLGDSKEGKAIKDMLDKATAPTPFRRETTSLEEAQAMAAQYGTTYELRESPNASSYSGMPVYVVETLDGPGPGVGKNEVQGTLASLKAYTDALQSETSMQMIRVQQGIEQCSQIVNVCSNTLRKLHEMAMAAIGNMRG